MLLFNHLPFLYLATKRTFGVSSVFLILFHLVVTSWILNANKMSAIVVSITKVESTVFRSWHTIYLEWMKISERNSSNGIDTLPLRNQGIGISMAELLGFPLFILIHHFWVIFISKAACGTFAQSFGSAFSRCEIGRMIFLSLMFLLMWDMEWQCHRSLSHLVIYQRWDALGELEEIEIENAVIKGVLLHKSIPWEELIWTFLIKYRSNSSHPWSISDSERHLPFPMPERCGDMRADLLQKSVI